MPAYSLCCLSAINLAKLVNNPFTDEAKFDFNRFRELVQMGVRFLDNVLDATDYPLERIEYMSKEWRRIGLGVTGVADMMLKMKIRYGSQDSVYFVDELAEFMAEASYNASIDLAIEKGSFPAFDKNIGKAGFITKLSQEIQDEIQNYGLRNIGILTIAPCGTTSLTLGDNCSSGIEPIFSLQYDRNVRQEDNTQKVDTVYDAGWLEYLEHFPEMVGSETLPDYVVVSHEVSIKEGIDVQAAFQNWIDHSISKTINMPYETTLEEYKDIFTYAWSKGLKGTTSFHEGASMDGILSTKPKEEVKPTGFWEQVSVLPNAMKRPETLDCDIYEMTVNKQKMVVLVGKYEDKPYEVFITANADGLIDLDKAKQGIIRKTPKSTYDLVLQGKNSTFVLEDITSIFDNDLAAMCRLLSLAMRHHIPLQFITDQLNKTKRFDNFSKIMVRVLKKYIDDGEAVISHSSGLCPECETPLNFVEGCKTCPSCGWSKC